MVKPVTDEFIIFSGTANRNIAASIAQCLRVRLGACNVERFPDGELVVRLVEPVRHKEIFIVQPTSPPVNGHLMKLLAFADASRRASAARVTAIIPYFACGMAPRQSAVCVSRG